MYVLVNLARECPVAFVYAPTDASVVEDTKEARRAIGARIRQARLACGLDNASEFARRVSVTPTTVYRWEAGSVVPSVFTLYDIAAVCGVSMEWLIGGEEPDTSAVLSAWLDSPSGQSAAPDAIAFLRSMPLLGYEPSPVFYDLAMVAWRNGLSRDEAARAAKATALRS